MKNFLELYKSMDQKLKRVSFFIFLTYFLILFSYPLMRSATSAIFYDVYTSADYSFATLIGVLALMGVILINNQLQWRVGVHKLFIGTGLFSIIVLALSFYGYKSGIKEMAYVIFAAKESYIVLLIHICLAYTNAVYDLEQFRRLIGPIGAGGSIGGIVGGQLTTYLANSFGTQTVFFASLGVILLTLYAFHFTKSERVKDLSPSKSITPFKAIRGVKKYVFLIALIVGLSQFVIFIADLQFNIIFEKVITLKDERTAYLGQFYSYINLISLLLQFFVLPFLLVRVHLKNVFLFVPILYLFLIFGGLSLGGGSILVIGSVFIAMKGTDYSVFGAAKEIMYHPLLGLQKFGAKYIVDMFIYRIAKALIAFLMAQFVISEMNVLTGLQFLFLMMWVGAIILLFKEQRKIKSK